MVENDLTPAIIHKIEEAEETAEQIITEKRNRRQFSAYYSLPGRKNADFGDLNLNPGIKTYTL